MSKLLIGIDTGTHTGLAVWDVESQRLVAVETTTISQAMVSVKWFAERSEVFVRFEDARQRKWFGRAGREQLQGAGSIKRDCSIWEDYLTEQGIPFEMVAPKHNVTKMSAEAFKRITGWAERTSEHSRDAAMLVYGR